MPPTNLPVTRNPTLQDIATLLEAARGGALRAAKDDRTDDVYVWDAAVATHIQMLGHLGLIMGRSLGLIKSLDQARRILKGRAVL